MKSIWQRDIAPKKRKQLTGTYQEKVVVIGAGMAGVLTGYLLQEAGISVTVLEADTLGSGQTGRTTAKITSQHGMIYQYLKESFGAGLGEQYAKANEAAIQEYARLVGDLKLDCGFRRCPAYLYGLKGEGAEQRFFHLEQEIQAARELGISAELSHPKELPFAIAGAELFPEQACFHPLRFLHGLADVLTLYEHSRVQRVEENRVYTNEGMIEADAIVFAVHYPWMVVPGYYFLRLHQERSYVLALHSDRGLSGMYRDMEKGGASLRSFGEYLLLGGSGHRTGKNKAGGNYEELLRQANQWKLGNQSAKHPEMAEAARWSAQDCVPLDRVPYIGLLSAAIPNWYVATGFGKWGMTGSMVSAMIIRDMILGRMYPYEEIFSPRRRNWKASAPQLMGNVGSAVVNLSRRLWPVGENRGCRHMGCRLNYNPEEDTWDCPCHGSRYDRKGKLLDGPAQKPL